jgi:hypothetical protein
MMAGRESVEFGRREVVYIQSGEVITFGRGQQVREHTFVRLDISFLVTQ